MRSFKILLTLIILLVNSQSAKIFAQSGNLIAYYKFDGNTTDQSSYSNHGTLHDGYFSYDRKGNPNGALFFNGSTYVEVPNSASLNPTVFTISAWVKLISNSNWSNFVVSKGGDGSTGHYGLHVMSDTHCIQSIIGKIGGTQIGVNSNSQISFNKWSHICSVYDGKDLKVYVDGELSNSISATGNYELGSNTESLFIGKNNHYLFNYQYWFNGFMDDIRIFNIALSDNDIKLLFNDIYTDIKKTNDTDINIYSIHNKIFLHTNTATAVNCEIYSTNGILLSRHKIDKQQSDISVGDSFQNGIYIIKVLDRGNNILCIKKVAIS